MSQVFAITEFSTNDTVWTHNLCDLLDSTLLGRVDVLFTGIVDPDIVYLTGGIGFDIFTAC